MLATVPALVLAGQALTVEGALRAAVFLISGLGIVVCGLVRDAGRRTQARLWNEWGGSPAVQRLRWRGSADPEEVRRLHEQLALATRAPMPSEALEAADPEAADRRYLEAIAVLRAATADRSRFPTIFAENVNYGFRRNALGMRSVALAVAAAVLLTAAALVIAGPENDVGARLLHWGPAGATAIVAGFFWAFVVRPTWVRDASELYVDRLLEAVPMLTDSRIGTQTSAG